MYNLIVLCYLVVKTRQFIDNSFCRKRRLTSLVFSVIVAFDFSLHVDVTDKMQTRKKYATLAMNRKKQGIGKNRDRPLT
jgi:hypothetical protein